MELHRATGDSLAHTMNNQGKEKSHLKQRIVELEVDLSPRLLFAKPLTIFTLWKIL